MTRAAPRLHRGGLRPPVPSAAPGCRPPTWHPTSATASTRAVRRARALGRRPPPPPPPLLLTRPRRLPLGPALRPPPRARASHPRPRPRPPPPPRTTRASRPRPRPRPPPPPRARCVVRGAWRLCASKLPLLIASGPDEDESEAPPSSVAVPKPRPRGTSVAQKIRDGRERITRAASFEKRMSTRASRVSRPSCSANRTAISQGGPTDAPVILLKGWLHAQLAQSGPLPPAPCSSASAPCPLLPYSCSLASVPSAHCGDFAPPAPLWLCLGARRRSS